MFVIYLSNTMCIRFFLSNIFCCCPTLSNMTENVGQHALGNLRQSSNGGNIMGQIKQTKWTTYNMFLQLFLKYYPSLWKICNVTYMTLGIYFSIEKNLSLSLYIYIYIYIYYFFAFPQHISKWLLFREDKTKPFFRIQYCICFATTY